MYTHTHRRKSFVNKVLVEKKQKNNIPTKLNRTVKHEYQTTTTKFFATKS